MITKYKSLIIKISFCIFLCLFLLTYIDSRGFYLGHDGLFHANRLEGIVKSLEDKQFLARVYPYTNNGYGYAVPLFYCDLLLYPFALLYKLGVPLITSYVLMTVFYSYFSIFAMMWASSKIFSKNKMAPYIATLLFSFCNYRLLGVYTRSALGETLATCFVPFVFYALYSIFYKKENSWICLGISYAGLAVTHNITLFIYSIYFMIIFIISVFLEKDKSITLKTIKTSIQGVLLAILLSSFYLLPLLEQILSQDFMCTKYFINEYSLASSSLNLKDVLSPYYIDSSLNRNFNLGTIITLLPILYIFIKNKNKYITHLVIIYVLSLLCLLGMFPIIYRIKILNIMQYSWRINMFLFPLAVLLSTYVLINIDKKAMYTTLIVFLITSAFAQSRFYNYFNKYIDVPRRIVSYDTKHQELYDISELEETFYYNFYEMYTGEYLPPQESYNYLKETTYIKRIEGDNFDEVKDGNNNYLQYERHGTNITFKYDSNNNDLLMVPLIDYKGYSVYCDKNTSPTKLDVKHLSKYKLVAFNTISGNHEYTVHYDGTFVQFITSIISFVTLSFVIFIYIRRNRFN